MTSFFYRIVAGVLFAAGILLAAPDTGVAATPYHQDQDHHKGLRLRHYDLQVRFFSDIYPVRSFRGLVSLESSGRRRLTVYWKEPCDRCFDTSDYFAYTDLIFGDGGVEGLFGLFGAARGRFSINVDTPAPQLRVDRKDKKALLVAVVALAARQAAGAGSRQMWVEALCAPLRRAQQADQDHIRTWTVDPAPVPIPSPQGAPVGTPVPFFPPAGRTGRLTRERDGTLRLRISRAVDDCPVLECSLAPASLPTSYEGLFDPRTLGSPPHVPAAWTDYWKLVARYWNLPRPDAMERRQRAAAIHRDALELAGRGVPGAVGRPLLRLAARAAAVAGDPSACLAALDAHIAKTASSTDLEDTLFLMGQLEGLTPETPGTARRCIHHETEQRVDRLLERFPDHDSWFGSVAELVRRKRYRLAEAVISAMRARGQDGREELNRLQRDIDARRVINSSAVPGYVQEFRGPGAVELPAGEVGAAALRNAIFRALVAADMEESQATFFAAEVSQGVRRLVGPGPYPADVDGLRKGIRRARERGWPREDEDAVSWLASLTALSFYDQSSEEHHAELTEQLSALLNEAADVLWEHLGELEVFREVTSAEKLRRRASNAMPALRERIEDPLWPMFKYPLSDNEMTRVRSMMVQIAEEEARGLRQSAARQARMAERGSEEWDPAAVRDRLQERISWMSRRLETCVFKVRRAWPLDVGITMRTRQPLRMTWNVPLPENREEAEELLRKMFGFYVGHRLKAEERQHDE